MLMKICLLTGDMEIGFRTQDVCATSSVIELHESRVRVEKRPIRLIFRVKLPLDCGTVRTSEPPRSGPLDLIRHIKIHVYAKRET